MKVNIKKSFLLSSVILLLVTSLYFYPFGGTKEGTAIVLYGIPCSGKSTLAAALKKSLNDEFVIVKRQQLVDKLRKDFIKELTGKNIKTRQELIQEALKLPEEQKREFFNYGKVGLYATLKKISDRVKNGENIIFDVCLSDPDPINRYQIKNIVKVLVYAPIPVLSERELARAEHREHTKLFQQRRRAIMLNMYTKLYRPELGQGSSLGILHRRDVDDYFAAIKGDLVYPKLQESVDKTILAFDLHKQNSVRIIPQKKPDLLINTNTHTPKKAAKIVSKYLIKRFGEGTVYIPN